MPSLFKIKACPLIWIGFLRLYYPPKKSLLKCNE
jgi:hypothetical protein